METTELDVVGERRDWREEERLETTLDQAEVSEGVSILACGARGQWLRSVEEGRAHEYVRTAILARPLASFSVPSPHEMSTARGQKPTRLCFARSAHVVDVGVRFSEARSAEEM